MKVEPTKGINEIQVKHNKVLFWIILVLIALFIVLIIYMMANWSAWEAEKDNRADTNEVCTTDSDCVKDDCCHASGCVSLENAPECGELFCTDECALGTLDCGSGECGCVEGKCEAVFVE